jgi:ABC-type multidrug transport system fused ATPase/permease subunit
MEGEIPASKASTIRAIPDLWRLLRGHHVRFVVATLLQVSSNVIWLYPAYALSTLVNFLTTYTPGASLRTVWVTVAFWIAASLWHYAAEQLSQFIMYSLSERASLNAQLRATAHLLRLDLSWHERENSGNKLKRIQRGGEGINRIARIWVDSGISALIYFFGMIPILIAFDRTVGLITAVFLVTFTIMSYWLTQRAGHAAHVVNTAEEELQGVAFEAISNVRSVKVLGMHEGLLAIIGRSMEDLMRKIRVRIRAFRTRDILMQFYAQTFRLGITFFIVYRILQGEQKVGFLVLFYTYFNYLWEAIDRLSRVALDYIIAAYGIMRMMDILEEDVVIDAQRGKISVPSDWKTLELKELSFSYGNKQVLHRLSLTIRRGERVGIVGVSGAGKSTLFKLLLKEHENYEGQILLGGVPLRHISRDELFSHSAVVLQDTEVFHFTLRDNITLANLPHAKDEALLEKALQVAHVTDFLPRMPEGVETYIGEKGIKLSGGEKQRVGIARAIFKQPEILFLDEATSHLDVESEEKIQDSLHQFFHSVTAVVIAHRLSTIKEMDRIVVLEEGRIVEEGSFDALHDRKGRFYELWEKQKF